MPLDNEDIKQLIAILQKGLSSDTVDHVESEQEEQKIIKPKRGRIQKNLPDNKAINKKARKSANSNKFDEMMEKNLHKEDLAVDKLLSKYPPTTRSRSFVPVDVKCRVCGRQENINPALLNDAPNRYKCNRCSKEPG